MVRAPSSSSYDNFKINIIRNKNATAITPLHLHINTRFHLSLTSQDHSEHQMAASLGQKNQLL